jgi:hypothetical protein
MIIIKNRSLGSTDWLTLHTSAGLTGDTSYGHPEYFMLRLNSSDARANYSADLILNPTATTFALGIGGSGWSNGSGSNYIAYCFAEVDGFSKFGSYTGNGSADGPFVYTGFRPAFVMFKRSAATGDRAVTSDSKRGPVNFIDKFLDLGANLAEGTLNITGGIDYLSNGFKCRHTDSAMNASGGTYIYMAFAEAPFKTSRAR